MTTATKARPMQFTETMVAAIWNDLKTQTRRIVQFRDPRWIEPLPLVEYARDGMPIWWSSPPSDQIRQSDYYDHGMPCRYGKPGDHIWVKHPTRITGRSATGFRVWDLGFPQEGNDRYFRWEDFPHKVPKEGRSFGQGLPRMLSRITLELLEVRVQRLQEITEEDAIAEGIPKLGFYELLSQRGRDAHLERLSGRKLLPYYVRQYRDLWERIHGAGSWELNPWVWALTFKKVS